MGQNWLMGPRSVGLSGTEPGVSNSWMGIGVSA